MFPKGITTFVQPNPFTCYIDGNMVFRGVDDEENPVSLVSIEESFSHIVVE
jgi:hypothetical protein